MHHATLLFLSFGLTACGGEARFDGQGGATKGATVERGADREETSADSVAVRQVAETFELAATKQQIDLVWVIDNSGSMTEENRIARQNLDAFVAKVSSSADLHLALISTSQGEQPVKLSDTLKSPQHLQLDVQVDSTNLLGILAAATCPAESTTEYQGQASYGYELTLCGKDFKSKNPSEFFENAVILNDVRGKLQGFYRPNARKVFVFVTDDDAQFVDSSNFLPLVQPHLGKEGGAPVVFAFQAVEGATCDVAKVGSSYATLARQTKGETFDICARDWSEHFSRLTKAVERVGAQDLKLNQPAKEVLSIAVDGVKLQSDGTVKLAETVFNKEPKKIEVVYLPN